MIPARAIYSLFTDDITSRLGDCQSTAAYGKSVCRKRSPREFDGTNQSQFHNRCSYQRLRNLLEYIRPCRGKNLQSAAAEEEDDANKVGQLVAKSAAAMLLSSTIGDQFDAICMGAADKGTWVRVFHPPIEGRLLHGYERVDVGNRLRVRLIHVDVDKGFIDFENVPSNL